MSSILLSLLEAFSLAACLPLFYRLLESGRDEELPFPDIFSLDKFSWVTILTALVVIFLLKNSLASWLTFKQLKFVNTLYTTYTKKVYEQFYSQRWTEYVRNNTADTFRKIRNTAFDFSHYVLHAFLILASDFFTCLTMIGLLAWLDYRIVFIVFGLGVPIIVFYYVIRKNIVIKIDKSFRDLTPQANRVLTQGIDSFAESKIYGKEDFFIDRFISLCITTSGQLTSLKMAAHIPSKLLETIGILSLASAILYGKFVSGDHQDLIIFFGLLALAMYKIIPSLSRIVLGLSQIMAYSYSVSELENNLFSSHPNPPPKHETLSFKQAIDLTDIGFSYKSSSNSFVLQSLNMRISKGDFAVLVGPSGIGKTTLIYILSGLITEYQGQVAIDKTILSPNTLQSWRNKIGLVSQSPTVLQDTILRNIAFGEDDEDIDFAAVDKSVKLAGLDEFINTLPIKLNTSVGENGLTLSGGQRQRLMLARALYRDPEVLMLDEVTNQLDEINKHNILKTLSGLTKTGKTIVLASHDSVARSFANKVFSFQKNGIKELKTESI